MDISEGWREVLPIQAQVSFSSPHRPELVGTKELRAKGVKIFHASDPMPRLLPGPIPPKRVKRF